MPIFEYTCESCNEKFDVLVPAETEIVCTKCGSEDVKKLLSVFSVGSGTTAARKAPGCANGCRGGFEQGCCGSGLCSG